MELLSKEQIEAQVSTVDLLIAMYPSSDEITIDATITRWLDILRDWSNSPADDNRAKDNPALSEVPASLSFELTVDIIDLVNENLPHSDPDLNNIQTTIQLSIDVPLRSLHTNSNSPISIETTSNLKIRLRQPPWMNKTQTTQANSSIPPSYNDDVLSTIDHLRASAAQHFLLSTTPSHLSQPLPTTATQATPLLRVWFYFPSLSTRSKRNDLVTYAPNYDLTGFVLAGKPGLLCLEGSSANIDEYMSFIKTESWSDIPSAHKKVSERVREVVGNRVFEGMSEITGAEWMERRGERGNRNDLRALEAWLEGFGLGGVLGRVVM